MEYLELKEFIHLEEKVKGNQLKDVISTHIINKWLRNDGIGFIEAFTGFGKTFMCRKLFTRYRAKNNDNIIVLVPNTALYNDFISIGKELHLENYYVYIINSYVLSDKEIVRECGLLIIDELHRFCSELSDYFKTAIPKTNYNRLLGLSATLEDKHKEFLGQFGIKEIFSINLTEGIRLNLIPEFEVLNVGVDLAEEDRINFIKHDKIFRSTFKYFSLPAHNSFELMMACSMGQDITPKVTVQGFITTASSDSWRNQVLQHTNLYSGLSDKDRLLKIKNLAYQCRSSMKMREDIINNSKGKLEALVKIINTITESNKTKEKKDYSLSFVSSIEQADELEKFSNHKALAYHSKLTAANKRNRLSNYSLGVFYHLLTISALDEGYSNKKINIGINFAYTGKVRTAVQRIGRTIRLDADNPDKNPLFIFLYHLPFYILDDDSDEPILPNDYKKLKTIQQDMFNIKYITLEQCLETIRKR